MMNYTDVQIEILARQAAEQVRLQAKHHNEKIEMLARHEKERAEAKISLPQPNQK